MNLIQRVQNILLAPDRTWAAIEHEPGDVASVYRGYVIYLAALPAIAGFIGLSLVGVADFGIRIRLPLVAGLVNMVVSYAMSLVMVFVLALIVDGLAPTFQATKSPANALKLVAYGMTASFVGGLFLLLPSLGALSFIAALYSVYLLYTGLPVLMKCPPDKAPAYTAVVMVCGVVAAIIGGAVTANLVPGRGLVGLSASSGLSAGEQVLVGSRGSGAALGHIDRVNGVETHPTVLNEADKARLAEAARQMEDAGLRMAEAQRMNDTATAGKIFSDAMSTVSKATEEPIAADDMKVLLPEYLGAFKRESMEIRSNPALGFAGMSADASYQAGSQEVHVTAIDMGGVSGLAVLASWANTTLDRDADGRVERVYKEGGRTVRENYLKDGSHGEYAVVLLNGVVVTAEGDHVEQASLKALVSTLELGKIEALRRPIKP